jgi:hypothetical protein
MLRVAADRLDEVRNEVVPPLELDVDARPALLDELREPSESVVGDDEPHERHACDDREHAAGRAETIRKRVVHADFSRASAGEPDARSAWGPTDGLRTGSCGCSDSGRRAART